MPYKGGFNRMVTRETILKMVTDLPYQGWAKKGVMLHNTWRPTMAQEDAFTQKHPKGQLQRLINFGEGHFKPKGWAGPHLFIFNDGPDNIGLGCPLHLTGVGSPGFNAVAWHIEMVADFTPGVDDDDSGKGFVVKDTACYCIALLLWNQGFDADNAHLWLHFEDRETTHKGCPGKDIEKADILARVKQYMLEIEEPGDHIIAEMPKEEFKPKFPWVDVPIDDPLNVRQSPGFVHIPHATLKRGTQVKVVEEQANGTTVWSRIENPVQGWVSGRFLVKTEPSKVVESFPEPKGLDRGPAGVKYLMDKGVPKYKAAAAIARFQRESYPRLIDDVWGDYMYKGKPAKKGEPGAEPTAFGIAQWRGVRLEGLRKLSAARQQPMDYFYLQLDYFLEEIASSPEVKLATKAWNEAKTYTDAVKAMMHYERPKGYKPDSPQSGDGYKETIAFGEALLKQVA